uniref:hypothetical protein n=1 Tax=Nonomuraea pusilla TaxID=46177 RepID=UPI00191C610D|nr:hypothetical protein [Nonomuraea pusilla]
MNISRRATLTEDERLAALRRLLVVAHIPQRLRVAGITVLLHAQPLTRVVQLTVDDLFRDGEDVFLHLAAPPSPVPGPVAALLLDYIAARDNMNTATNRASRSLFPGRRAGQPCRPDHLSAILNEIGIPATAAHGAAIRRLLLEMPAPVVADALSYHDKTTVRLQREGGGGWSRHAGGKHGTSSRGPMGTTTRDS